MKKIAVAILAVLAFAGCHLGSTTSPTIVQDNIAFIINAGPSGTVPAAGGSGSLCGIQIASVKVSGPATFVHGSGAQDYTATPLDAGGTDITTECSSPATATFTNAGVVSGTAATLTPNSESVTAASAGAGSIGANIGGVASAPFIVQVS